MKKPWRGDLALSKSVWLALAGATAGIAVAYLRMGWQPILADEWNFFLAMKDWIQHRAEIPHPQAYLHLGQLSMAIFGVSTGSARLVGVFSAILSIWLIPVLVRYVWPEEPPRNRLTLIAIGLTAICPLTLQNMMLLDIDNTLLIPATMLVVIAWAALSNRSARLRISILSILLALSLWVKLPTPPLLMAALGLYHLVRAEWKRVGEIILISAAGLLLFAATFEIYTLVSGYQWAYFAPTFSRSGDFFNLRDLLARFPQGLGVFIIWLSWPLTILLVAVVWQTLQRMWRRQTSPADALTFYVVIVALIYPLIYIPAWGYPRYQAPIFPIALTLIAALIAPATLGLSRRALAGLTALTLLLIATNWLLLPDPLYPIYQATFEGGLYDMSTRLSSALKVAGVVAVPIGLVLLAGWLIARAKRLDRSQVFLNLLGVLAVASLISVSLVQITAGYSTRYRYTYDYAGYLWTVQQARAAGPGAYVLAIKDTLDEAGVGGAEIYPFFQADYVPSLAEVVRSRRVDALIWTTKEEARSDIVNDPALVAVLARCYDRKVRDVFIVYSLKPGVTCR